MSKQDVDLLERNHAQLIGDIFLGDGTLLAHLRCRKAITQRQEEEIMVRYNFSTHTQHDTIHSKIRFYIPLLPLFQMCYQVNIVVMITISISLSWLTAGAHLGSGVRNDFFVDMLFC